MSWNPRRFVERAYRFGGIDASCRFLWLTDEALERIQSALDSGVLRFPDKLRFPDGGLCIGLARTIGCDPETDAWGNTRRGYAADVIMVPPLHNRAQRALPDTLPVMCLDRGASGYPTAAVLLATVPSDTDPTVPTQLVEGSGRRVRVRDGSAYNDGLLMGGFLSPDDSSDLMAVVVAALLLADNPTEREVSATTATPTPVRTGKRRTSPSVDIAVIDVRRRTAPRQPTATGRVVEHDHRWTVRGHWRMQPFGPGREQRRRIWIDSHIAGPDDKPLRDRPKVEVLRG